MLCLSLLLNPVHPTPGRPTQTVNCNRWDVIIIVGSKGWVDGRVNRVFTDFKREHFIIRDAKADNAFDGKSAYPIGVHLRVGYCFAGFPTSRLISHQKHYWPLERGV